MNELFCAPLHSLDGNSVSGAIQLLNKNGDENFNDEDKQLLEELAHFLSLHIENIAHSEAATQLSRRLLRMASAAVGGAVVMLTAAVIAQVAYTATLAMAPAVL